ncbi:MAG: phosphoenolpyruvate---glycerone phosphotransferase subunit DhaL [Gaiellales bacterium]|nr:phosphoenolpyruvate---glycerone phosphotransferase subunit DhaL [Gaiellales bacterium]
MQTARWMRECSAAIAAQKDYLTQLDAAIGDADHGVNMTRGFAAVESKMDELDGGTPPGKLLVAAGQTLVSTVGGASGPLWGTALRRAGKAMGEAEQVDAVALAEALQAAVAGVVELGAAQPGDKTMVDALQPAVDALRAGVDGGGSLPQTLAEATAAAEQGMRETVPMLARKGRASYLGERSIGHQDPGATSAALIVAALERALTDGQ